MVYKCLCHILYFARCVKQRTAFAYTVLFQNPQVLISIKKIKRFVPMTDNTFCSNIFYENKIAEESCYYRQRQIKVSYQLMCWGEDSLALLQLCWFVTAESCIWIQNLIWWGILECVCLWGGACLGFGLLVFFQRDLHLSAVTWPEKCCKSLVGKIT